MQSSNRESVVTGQPRSHKYRSSLALRRVPQNESCQLQFVQDRLEILYALAVQYRGGEQLHRARVLGPLARCERLQLQW